MTLSSTRQGYSLIEILVVAGILVLLISSMFYAVMTGFGSAAAEKAAEIVHATADAKECFCQIVPDGASQLATNSDDVRWQLIAPYMQLMPTNAATNRFILLQSTSSSLTNFTVGDATTAPVIK